MAHKQTVQGTRISELLLELDHLFQEKLMIMLTLCQSLQQHQTTRFVQFRSILVLKLLNTEDKETSERIHTFQLTIHLHSIMSMGQIVLKVMSMKTQQDRLFFLFQKDIMPQFWLMVKQVLERHTPWKGLSIIKTILNEVSFLDQWKKSLDSSKTVQINIRLSWSELPIFKYITKISQTS